MKIKLKVDIIENDYIKQSPRKKPTFKDQQQRDPVTGKRVTVSVPVRVGAEPILWATGAVIEASDTTAQKYIERGWAEEYIPEKSEENKK